MRIQISHYFDVKISCVSPTTERLMNVDKSIRALYCNTHYIATSPKTHSNQYPNPKQYPKPCPNTNTIVYALIKCRNIAQSQYSARTG